MQDGLCICDPAHPCHAARDLQEGVRREDSESETTVRALYVVSIRRDRSAHRCLHTQVKRSSPAIRPSTGRHLGPGASCAYEIRPAQGRDVRPRGFTGSG